MSPNSRMQRRLKGISIALALGLPLAFSLGASTPSNAEASILPAVVQKNVAGDDELIPAPEGSTPALPSLPAVRAVTLVTPKTESWPDRIDAQGNVMPWQEARIGTEIGGLRLVSVLANVGDVVKKGQVLAELNPVTVQTELEAANAQLMEVQATLAQAVATLDRARRLAPSGGVSQQELTLYETQKQTAQARINAAQAQVKTQQLRLDSATLVAPDDGVISSRSAAEGAIVQSGSELFRLIRQGRLEWRAEVKGETLMRLAVGQEVTVKSPLGEEVKGRVRQISPTIDLTTRNGLVYVDLPADNHFKSGLHVTGTLIMSKRKALVVPASAVAEDAGQYRVFRVNAENRVEVLDVQLGRKKDAWVEIISGLDGQGAVIARDVEVLKAGEAVEIQKTEAGKKVSQAPAEQGVSGD